MSGYNDSLEDKYMKAWQVVDDIDLLYRQIGDTDFGDNKDNVMNALLGMYTIYQLRFEELQTSYEKTLEIVGETLRPESLNEKIIGLESQVKGYEVANNKLSSKLKDTEDQLQLVRTAIGKKDVYINSLKVERNDYIKRTNEAERELKDVERSYNSMRLDRDRLIERVKAAEERR